MWAAVGAMEAINGQITETSGATIELQMDE